MHKQKNGNPTPGRKILLEGIDIVDLRAFLGIVYMRGLYHMNGHRIDTPFSDIHGHSVFSATMSRQRFQFILANLTCDDAEDRSARWQCDRFAAIRYLFEECNKLFARVMIPECYLSLDETLYPMRIQINLDKLNRQYNSDKPAKYGMLFKSINSATYPYTYQSHIYCGKPKGEPNEFYISGTENYIQYLVNKLSSYHDIRQRNISTDRLYSSLSVTNWLLDKGITMVGTTQKNRVGSPASLKDVTNREINSTEKYWEKNRKRIFTSYISKTIDQKMGYYTVKTKSRRWTMVAFAYLLDPIRVNASIVLAVNKKVDPKKKESFDFGFELAKSLVMPQIERRSMNDLNRITLQKIALFTDRNTKQSCDSQANIHPWQSEIRKRWRACLESIQGKDQKLKKEQMKKTKSLCQKCGENFCNEHLIQTCQSCWNL